MPNPYAPEWTSTLHPDVIELGLKYASGEISGDNARCRSMMHCFMQVLNDYVVPPPPSTNNNKLTLQRGGGHDTGGKRNAGLC